MGHLGLAQRAKIRELSPSCDAAPAVLVLALFWFRFGTDAFQANCTSTVVVRIVFHAFFFLAVLLVGDEFADSFVLLHAQLFVNDIFFLFFYHSLFIIVIIEIESAVRIFLNKFKVSSETLFEFFNS